MEGFDFEIPPDDMERWERRERELWEFWRPRAGAARDPGEIVEDCLRREVAEAYGLDLAAMEALALVRKHGLRRARQLNSTLAHYHASRMRDGVDPSAPGELEHQRRVRSHLTTILGAQPWWRRIFL